MRSRLTLSKPGRPRRRGTPRAPRAAEWPRASARRSASRSDCAPSEMRVTPAARRPHPVGRLAPARVGLEGDLLGIAHPSVHGRPDQALDRAHREQGRRAAAEVDRRQASGRRPQGQLGVQRGHVARDGVAPPADRHEVAVRAHQPAERHVDVEVVTRRGLPRHARHAHIIAGGPWPICSRPEVRARRARAAAALRSRRLGWPPARHHLHRPQMGRCRRRPPAKANRAAITTKCPTMAGSTDPVSTVAQPQA